VPRARGKEKKDLLGTRRRSRTSAKQKGRDIDPEKGNRAFPRNQAARIGERGGGQEPYNGERKGKGGISLVKNPKGLCGDIAGQKQALSIATEGHSLASI